MKQEKQPTDPPEVAKLLGLRACFREIGDLKFASLVFVLLCLLRAKSCNLSQASDYAPADAGQAKAESNYVRLCRFFATGIGDLLQKGVFRAVLRLAVQSGSPLALVIDRTDWQLGSESWCNLLAVGLSFKGHFIPLVWEDLGRRGNSDAGTRTRLLDRMVEWWPLGDVSPKQLPLLADREFAGEQWLLELAKRGFSFVVRLKSNRKLTLWCHDAIRERPAGARPLRRFLARKGLNSTEIVLVDEYLCHFVAVQNTAGRDPEPWLYLFTNLDDPQLAGPFYRLRWTIECCFKHLKSNGFNLEDHAFKKAHQIEILMAIVVLLYSICVCAGTILLTNDNAKRKIPRFKKYKNGTAYQAKSSFRIGLAYLIQLVLGTNPSFSFVNELLNWFSTTYTFT